MIDRSIRKAYAVLDDGKPVSPSLAMELAGLGGEDVVDLLSLAHKVRNRFSPGMHACSIVNARSGECPENCRFCAQSAHHAASVETYDLLDRESLLAAAGETHRNGVSHFGIVTSGTGFPEINGELREIISAVRTIKERIPGMEVCASLGILGAEPVQALADCGISHYNINLQVAPGRYEELICDTHGVDERIDTIRSLKKAGVKDCCGAILGVGETMEDRVALAFAVQELAVEVIPLNVLIPVEGTPLEGSSPLTVVDAAKSFALFRLINPGSIIKFAAGRETVMRDFQGVLMLSGANGLLTGGYLTTRGREVDADRAFIGELAGFDGD